MVFRHRYVCVSTRLALCTRDHKRQLYRVSVQVPPAVAKRLKWNDIHPLYSVKRSPLPPSSCILPIKQVRSLNPKSDYLHSFEKHWSFNRTLLLTRLVNRGIMTKSPFSFSFSFAIIAWGLVILLASCNASPATGTQVRYDGYACQFSWALNMFTHLFH